MPFHIMKIHTSANFVRLQTSIVDSIGVKLMPNVSFPVQMDWTLLVHQKKMADYENVLQVQDVMLELESYIGMVLYH